MHRLRANLSRVRIPEPSNKIYKDECCISFDTPKSDGGLFVDLNTFLAFGREHVLWNFEKSGDPIYLNIQRKLKPISDDRPLKRPTTLAIGVEGGFDLKGPEYEDFYKLVILPDFTELVYPNVNLPEKVRLSVERVLAAQGAERRDQVAEWKADKKRVSKYASSLKHLDNGATIPPTGWKCHNCDMTENLWMNLTDGQVLCGRRNWDGSGGNNHAVLHYEETGFPLAVKLGTITADLEQADVYSYAEDDTVEDPLLAAHLAHFGINFAALEKTEMTTAEKELDQNLNFDWFRIQEKGKELEPLFGPGYTGLANLGNSCYLASVMQVVFSTRDFQERYFANLPLHVAFNNALADPTLDIIAQLAKLGHGLLSGKYSVPSVEASSKEAGEGETVMQAQEGIPPRMFKTLIGTGHPEFSSGRQQDALEFFQHLLDVVERSDSGRSVDPSKCFRFLVEERIKCAASANVKYNYRVDNVLSLGIPLDAAVNKEEVEEYNKKQAAKAAAGEKMDGVAVRPRVPLSACLEAFSAEEEVADFYSSAIEGKTTAIKQTRLRTFPDYLVLHMKKFVHDVGWVARKLDVFIDVPDEIDLSHLHGKGLQPGEQELPDSPEPASEPQGPVADETIVQTLVEMGFPRVRCEKAAINTSNASIEDAMNWILSHMDDPDVDAPIRSSSGGGPSVNNSTVPVDDESLGMLTAIGCSKEVARRALQETGGDVERAAEWVFSHPDAEAMEIDPSNRAAADPGNGPAQRQRVPAAEDMRDGPGKYKLMAFISHMGSSTQVGHYVCHIVKDGRWVIFNDSKVAASGDPPKDMGYLYFFERVRPAPS